ncbi:MAG: OmpA family protein, partial [Povalibacter sp.]
MKVSATECRSANGTMTLSQPIQASGQVLDLNQPVALTLASTLHGGEAVFLRLTDADQNLDAAAIDYVRVRLSTPSGDREELRLAESGDDTGVFIGFIQTHAGATSVGNCVLDVERNAAIRSEYVDPADARDVSSATALVDPYGLIFNSSTGQPVAGARVRLVNTTTGTDADVFGDDGKSRYPAEMITGEAVTDSSGTVYMLPAGVFRFPLVAPGSYKVEVIPPAGHAFPSTQDATQLALVPGAPFRISDGSFGRAFTIDAQPTFALDVPVDPAPTQLFLQKSTTTTVAAVGDFVQYTLAVENTSKAAVPRIKVLDHLPQGARYRKGSARLGTEPTSDPEISADGQTLTFTLNTLGAGQRADLRYVVEITVGAHGKQLVNAAQAIASDGVGSNVAQATIQLREELFRERAILMGRVVEGNCGSLAHQQPGVEGVRVYLEDGRYSVTDRDGKYHFDDVAPGSHVVQMDTVTIPPTHLALACSDRVRNAGRAYSQFVDVRGGALWRGDFVLERQQPPKGGVTLKFQTRAVQPDELEHIATVNATGLGITNAQVQVSMPDGLSYVVGSATDGSKSIDDPVSNEGVLIFKLAHLDAAVPASLSFHTRSHSSSSGALNFKALARFDTPSQTGLSTAVVQNTALRGEMLYETASYRFSPRFDVLDANIQAADRVQLDKIVDEWRGVTSLRLVAIGHSDASLIAARNRVNYADNYALSRARAQAVADYLSQRLKIDPAQVQVEGRGADQPLAQGHDAGSLALNRRVEISIEGLRVVAAGQLTVKNGSAESEPVETVGVLAGTSVAAPARHTAHQVAIAEADMDVESVEPGTGWVLPVENEIPAIPSLRIVIRHLAHERIELAVNGQRVSPLNFDGVSTNRAGTQSVSRWRGVDLRDGDNTLSARVLDDSDTELATLERHVHYAGGAVRAEIARDASTLIADGRTHPVIALRMIDASGKPARPGTLGAWSIDAPYRSWWEVESLDDNKMIATGPREPTFSVDEDGLVRLELDPTTQAGTAVVHLKLSERQEQEIRVWLEPQARDWILVGIAEGTSAYNSISQNMQSAADAGLQEGYGDSNRMAFFAKGAIKGEYLLTLAYDSTRDKDEAKDRLLGVIEPDRFYTLYGD